MFNWTVTLSDKQVLMLMAFAAAKPDEEGNCFSAVQVMICDAWDVRSARKLQEDGLISVEEYKNEETGFRTSRWAITHKGKLIAEAVNEDAEGLRKIALRNGQEARRAVNDAGNEVYRRKRREYAQRKQQRKIRETQKS